MATDITVNGTVIDGENNVAANVRLRWTPLSVSGTAVWSAARLALTNASGLIKASDGTSDLVLIAGATYTVQGPVLGFEDAATITLPSSGPVDFATLVANTSYTIAGLTLKDEGTPLSGVYTTINVVGAGASIAAASAGVATLTVVGFSNPMTAVGDLILGGASGAPARFSKGTEGQYLTITGGVVAWGTGGAGGDWSELTGVPASISTIAGLTPATDRLPYYTGSGAAALATFTSAGRALVDDADASAQRTTLGLGSLATQSGTFSGASSGTNTGDQDLSGLVPTTRTVNGHALSSNVTVTPTDLSLVIGTNVQAFSSNLTTFASIAPSANVQTLLGATNFSTFRSSLGVAIGTDVQAWDADLDTWATKTPYAGTLTITTAKTVAFTKTMSLTAADDSGVYTFPTGTKTLLAADGSGASLTFPGALSIASGKTLTNNNNLTLTATDGATLAIGGGGTLGSNAYTSTAYAPLASPTFTGTVALPTSITVNGNAQTFPTSAATLARTDAGQTFTGVNIFTSPKIITDISDTNGNELFKFTATASAVNEFTITNAATGNSPILSATGSNTDIDINFVPKSTQASFVRVRPGGTGVFVSIGQQVDSNAFGAIFFGSVAPLVGAYSLSGDGQRVFLNAPSTTINFAIADVIKASIATGGAIKFGGSDGASPVNQTLSTQGTRGGTDSNIAGANFTIVSGLGTGNSTPSSLILQSPLIGSSGTTAQVATTGLTIKNGAAVLASYTVATLPSASTCGAGATAFVTDANTTFILGLGVAAVGGGSNKVPVYSDGSSWIVG